jgi:hypothetical protein
MRAFLSGVEVLQVHVAFACAGSPNLPLPRFDEETWNTFLNGEWRSGTFYEISKMCGWEANKEALKQRRGTDILAVSVGPQASKFHHV